MAWKLAHMVHQHIIEFWKKNVLFIEDVKVLVNPYASFCKIISLPMI
jgi:hypothetical protein